MNQPVEIQIVGALMAACGDGVEDKWREVAAWATDQLVRRFGEAVRVEYFDLLDPACPQIPSDAQLPLVMIAGEVLSSGNKISVPAIRKRLEAIGIAPDDH